MPPRLQDLALAALGLCALLLIGFAMRGAPALPALEATPLDLTGATTTAAGAAKTTTTAADLPTKTATPTGQGTATPEVESPESVTRESVTPTTVTPTDPGDPALATARQALAGPDPATVLVLGDSTSNTRDEWVHLWAQNLAQRRPVTISHWDESGQQGYVEPDVLSEEGDGGPVTIWSGSQSGYGPWYAEARLDDLVPEPLDLVLYSYGHLVAANKIAPSLGALHTALTEQFGQVPTVVLLQNSGPAEDNAVHDAAADWAADTDLPTIDVAAAFQATGDLAALTDDEGQPNPAGSQLWADTVAAALTG